MVLHIHRLQSGERDTSVTYREGDVDLARHLLLALPGRTELQLLQHPHRLGIELATQRPAYLIVADAPLGCDFAYDVYGSIHPPCRLYRPELLGQKLVQPLHATLVFSSLERLLRLGLPLRISIRIAKLKQLGMNRKAGASEEKGRHKEQEAGNKRMKCGRKACFVIVMSHRRMVFDAKVTIIYLFQKYLLKFLSVLILFSYFCS